MSSDDGCGAVRSVCGGVKDVMTRIHNIDVVSVARMVPVGMDFCASFRSPDLLEPAIIPERNALSEENQTPSRYL